MSNSEIRAKLDWLYYAISELHSGSPEEDYDGESDEILETSIEIYTNLRSHFS
jgi:hypothetical protein